MKYKVGQKVIIDKSLVSGYIRKILEKTNYVVTIDEDVKIYGDNAYRFEEIPGVWIEKDIKDHSWNSWIPTPIYSRFEILDL